MHLYRSRIQADGFDFDAHHLFPLQLLEHFVQHTALGPAVHAYVNRVPVAEALRQPAPLAAVFGHIQDRVQHRQVVQAHIAALYRQAILDACVLLLSDLHL